MPTSLPDKLLAWYETNARNLPWRGVDDPYLTWVSEIMLQQTRVETVIPYFKRWVERFPDVKTLAEADQDQVLNAWEGLGYYSRARNLHRSAKRVQERWDGKLPCKPEQLQELPGIGPYTAGALASMAFGISVPAIDGNVRRVIARLFNVEHEISSRRAQDVIREHVERHLPADQPGIFNQAIMDLGAMICTPRAPSCGECPLAEDCAAHKAGREELLPVRKSKTKIPHHTVTAAVIHQDGCVLLAKRPADALLGGLWEFPGGKQEDGESLPAALAREFQEELGVKIKVGEEIGRYQHAYTHYRITLHAFRCTLSEDEIELRFHTDWAWVAVPELDSFPMGKVDRAIAKQLQSRT